MQDLKEKLELHKKWLNEEEEGVKLDLSNTDLSNTDLGGADLRNVDLSGAYLSNTDLSGANLSGANLSGANLSDTNLKGANLNGAYLRHANLNGANLNGANLKGANLSGANLRYANLSGVDIRNCIGNNREIKSLQIGVYLVCYTKEILTIGCQSHNHSKWKSFYDDDILSMDGETALDWWHLNKHIIFELIDRESK